MKLAEGALYFPMGAGTIGLISDISQAMASSVMTGPDNNIFSWGTLKRINEGGFHRTTHPAMKSLGIGSWRMKQNKIPLAPAEPTFITALNSRFESIDVWNRYDNWMNSIQYSAATWGVDRTWWFTSNAQQWRIKANFIDTPSAACGTPLPSGRPLCGPCLGSVSSPGGQLVAGMFR